jgi:3-oxoacyl-[acyl-carrier-protein] synthase II
LTALGAGDLRPRLCHAPRVSAVVVAGAGVVSPFGLGADALLAGLCAARPAFAEEPSFARAGVRHALAARVPEAAIDAAPCVQLDDRGGRLLATAVRLALEDWRGAAFGSSLGEPAARTALVVGTSASGIGPMGRALASGAPRVADDARYDCATRAVAAALGVAGPVMTLGSVCAAGALAIAEACAMVASGEVDLALAAGFDPLEPFVAAGFDALGALTDEPRPFRLGRRGFVLGEGAAALVLVREAPSRPQGLGRVCGWGASADAHHLTAPSPGGEGLALAIARSLERAGLRPGAVGVVNAHGTGTPLNDVAEAAALSRALGPRAGGCPVHTLKGTIGHSLGASGAIEAVAALAAMRAGLVPPTLTQGEPDPACDLDLVVGTARPLAARHTLSISAGFGGANCALVLGAPEGAA